MTTRTYNNENGSALIWVLVCIALFVALSFTVTQMLRGSDNGGRNKELVSVFVSDIMTYNDAMRRTVQVMRANGIDVANMSFETESFTAYNNPRCDDVLCSVFHPNGGGVTYSEPNIKWLDPKFENEDFFQEWHIGGDSCVPHVGTGDENCASSDTRNEELIQYISYIQEPICLAMNKRLGIENPNSAPPTLDGCPWTSSHHFKGSFSNGGLIKADDHLNRHQAGCFKVSNCGHIASDSYHAYQVLLPR
jgi:hypothetical protein